MENSIRKNLNKGKKKKKEAKRTISNTNIMHQMPVQRYQDKYFQRTYTLANIVEA